MKEPACLLIKPPQNIPFRLLGGTLVEFDELPRFRKKYKLKVAKYEKLKDCVIARKHFFEEHQNMAVKISMIANTHDINMRYNPIYRNYSAFLQLDLLDKILPKALRKHPEISEPLEIYRKYRLKAAKTLLSNKYFRKVASEMF
jgi:hypothetical protein